jgi:hypothetical protein
VDKAAVVSSNTGAGFTKRVTFWTNFVDKWRSVSRYSSRTKGHGVCLFVCYILDLCGVVVRVPGF